MEILQQYEAVIFRLVGVRTQRYQTLSSILGFGPRLGLSSREAITDWCNRTEARRSDGRCWNCGRMGHLQSRCLKPSQNPSKRKTKVGQRGWEVIVVSVKYRTFSPIMYGNKNGKMAADRKNQIYPTK